MGIKLVQYLKNISDQARRWLICSLSLIMFLGGGYGCGDDPASDPTKDAPSAPTNLMSQPGNQEIALTWDMVRGASYYRIYRNGSRIANNITVNTYTDTGLTNGQEYRYQVSAVRDGAESERSVEVQGIPFAGAPPAPMNLMGQPGDRTITLTWDMVTGASYYRVYRNNSRIADNIMGITYTDTGLTNETSYSYQVSAVINVGSCSSCQVEGLRTRSISVSPVVLVAGVPAVTVQLMGSGQLTLRWNLIEGASHYKVYRDGSPVGGNVTGTTYTDTGLTNGQEYSYRVSAVKDGTEGARSAAVQGIPLPDAPSIPMNLMSQPGGQQVTLTWGMVTGASYYRVYRDGSRIANNITETTYTDTGLTNGTSYSYQVSAVLNVGSCSSCQVEGARSTSLRTMPSLPRPVAPVTVVKSGEFSSSGGYTVSGGGSIVRDSNNKLFVTLGSDFSSSAGPGLYVYLSQAMSVTSNNFLNLGGLRQNSGEQSYAIPSGTDVSSYTHIVIYCQPASVTFGTAALSSPLSAPANLMSQPGNQTITLTWDAVTGASYYRVYRGSSRIADNITGTTYTDTGLTNGTSYSYQVSTVLNIGSCSSCQVEGARSASLSVAPSNEPVGSVTVLKSGNFTNALYSPVSGRGSIVRDSNNNLFVMLGTDFTTPSGPDLNVYISQGYQDRNITNFLDLGDLRSTTGEQSYAIPSGTDIDPYTHIVIYCVGANGAFGKAAVSTP